MNFRKAITEYGSLAASIVLVLAALAFSIVPSNAAVVDASPEPLPENCFVPSDDLAACVRVEGTALYVDGVCVAVAHLEEELRQAVDTVALEQAHSHYDGADTYCLLSTVEYINGEFYENEFSSDLVANVKASGLSVYGVQTQAVSAPVAAPVLYRDNADLKEGYEKTLVNGVDGVVDEVYLIYYSEGRIVSSVLESSVVTVEPVTAVVERGVKLGSDKTLTTLAMFIMPYNGGISSEYGTRYLLGGTFHGGVDVAAKIAGASCYGEPVAAAGDGTVVEAGYHGDFGMLVVIEHSNGIRTYYAHMSSINVSVGQTVVQGQQIGNIGSTGKAEGPHVHFEVRLPDESGNYYRVDPKYYIINYSDYLRS